MFKVLVTLALLMLPVTGAFAQTANQSTIGFLLAAGSTYGSFTCPTSNIGPCFVPYGASIPTTPASGTDQPISIDQTTQGTTNGVVTKTGSITSTSPAARTLVTLDIKTVTTGGTAVSAISAGHRSAGGLLCNPQGATVNLGINEIGAASGTTSSGDTTFIVPGQCYKVAPATTAVSVITSDSSHPFSGYGLQ